MQVDKCDVCGKLSAALSVCRLCGRRVCEEHFRAQEGLCSLCYGRLGVAESETADEAKRSVAAVKLFLVGFVLMFVGVVVLAVATLLGGGGGQVSGGAVIVIWFIPIVVGFGPYGFYAVLLAVVLSIIAFAVFVWMRRQVSKG